MNNIVTLPTNIMIVNPDDVLNGAKGLLKKCLVLGVNNDGSFFMAASHNEPENALLLMRGQEFLMQILGDREE